MSFKTLELKEAYVSDSDDILNDFYIPVLAESVKYYRLAGFFSSQSLAVAASGIINLIRNNGNMRLIVSPKLSQEDLKILIDTLEDPATYIESQMLNQLSHLEDEFEKDHLFALGWMIANNRLDIKIAIPSPLKFDNYQSTNLFHLKVGILEDKEGNFISFSGSLNESAHGWLSGNSGNIEEFKVFKSWNPSDENRLNADQLKFNKFWNNNSQNVNVVDLPVAIKQKLIQISPSDFNSIDLDKWYRTRSIKKSVKLFDHQINAVNTWFANDLKCIFEMATGTGKTITALECIRRVLIDNKNILIIICAPYHHLLTQWEDNIKKFGIEENIVFADSTNGKYKDILLKKILNDSIPYKKKENLIVLTTHKTFSSNDFINIMCKLSSTTNTMLVADEVHWLGAQKYRNGLLNLYKLRLGLSATPKRWFDDEGSKVVYKYFGEEDNVKYSFSLEDALTKINPATSETYLTPYYYYPYFIKLDEKELEEYQKLTYSIIKNCNKKDKLENDDALQFLLFKRANILKNAFNKRFILNDLILSIKNKEGNLDHTIIYCTDKQIDDIIQDLSNQNVIVHSFTMEEGVQPLKKYGGLSERQFVLQMFDESRYEVLVAIKCLDEGVDIPSSKNAILFASDGNPRQYIQRLGRILRRYPGKSYANIFDILVIPDIKKVDNELLNLEKSIIDKELKRYWEIARLSINNAEAERIISHIQDLI